MRGKRVERRPKDPVLHEMLISMWHSAREVGWNDERIEDRVTTLRTGAMMTLCEARRFVRQSGVKKDMSAEDLLEHLSRWCETQPAKSRGAY